MVRSYLSYLLHFVLSFCSEKEIQEFDRSRNSDGEIIHFKPIREFETVEILDLEEILYLVTGRDKIYLLGQEAGGDWARLLTATEIQDLQIDIHWEGEEFDFEVGSKQVTEFFFYIIFHET